jgi:hypothetical protein
MLAAIKVGRDPLDERNTKGKTVTVVIEEWLKRD